MGYFCIVATQAKLDVKTEIIAELLLIETLIFEHHLLHLSGLECVHDSIPFAASPGNLESVEQDAAFLFADVVFRPSKQIYCELPVEARIPLDMVGTFVGGIENRGGEHKIIVARKKLLNGKLQAIILRCASIDKAVRKKSGECRTLVHHRKGGRFGGDRNVEQVLVVRFHFDSGCAADTFIIAEDEMVASGKACVQVGLREAPCRQSFLDKINIGWLQLAVQAIPQA